MIRQWIWMLMLVLPMVAQAEPARVRPLAWAQPVIGVELGNFYQLTDKVYRSRQPDDEEMRMLESMGIRSILNLREYHSDEDEARGTRLNLYHVPVAAGDIDDRFVIEALRAIDQAEKPVLIHCWHGSDRTGVVSAMYRMVPGVAARAGDRRVRQWRLRLPRAFLSQHRALSGDGGRKCHPASGALGRADGGCGRNRPRPLISTQVARSRRVRLAAPDGPGGTVL